MTRVAMAEDEYRELIHTCGRRGRVVHRRPQNIPGCSVALAQAFGVPFPDRLGASRSTARLAKRGPGPAGEVSTSLQNRCLIETWCDFRADDQTTTQVRVSYPEE